MTDDSSGENNIESLAQRAKEVLDRVRSNADDVELSATPPEPVVSEGDLDVPEVDLDVPEVDLDTEVSAADTPGGYISAIQGTDDTDEQDLEVEEELVVVEEDPGHEDTDQEDVDPDEEDVDVESVIGAAIGLDAATDVDSELDDRWTDDEVDEPSVEGEMAAGIVDQAPDSASTDLVTTGSFDADSLRTEDVEEESNRRLGCLIPLFLLGLLILALILFWGSIFGEDDAAVLLDGDTVASTTSEALDATTSTAETNTTTSTTDTTTTTSTTTVEEPPVIPDTAWELLGGTTGTDQFASFGTPFGLQAILEGADAPGLDGFTLLAPSNEAIAALSQEDVASFGQDPASAEALINYHIIDQRLTPELLLSAAGGQIQSRIGLPIDVTLEGDDLVLNGQARVALDSLVADNAHVLVIDSVLQPPTINTVIELGEVQFEVISAIITPAGQTELQKAVVFFQDNPDANAVIEGHTDTDGPAGPNQGLSERRANAVRDFLISQGIDGARLTAEGFGETQPIIVDGVEDKVASRRIELNIR